MYEHTRPFGTRFLEPARDEDDGRSNPVGGGSGDGERAVVLPDLSPIVD